MSPIDLILARLSQVREHGQGRWMACCPAHEDHSPSLSIKEGADGTVLLHCFAGCTVHDVLNSMGCSFSDLFPHIPSSFHPICREPSPLSLKQAEEKLSLASFAIACAVSDIAKGKVFSEQDAAFIIKQALIIGEVRHVMGW